MTDVLIIGAGVVGGLLARELSLYELSVALVEKEDDVAMGATRANSAIVHAGIDAKEGSLKALLNVKGSEMMEQTAKELGVPYKRNGSIVVGFSEEDRAHLEELLARGVKNGVKGLAILDREELLKVEPGIGDTVTCALYAPTGAIVCPYDLAISAIGCAMDNGAELYVDFPVERIEAIDGGYRVYSGERVLEARTVINCAGVYADKIAAMVGDESFTVFARRGEYMLLDKECGGVCRTTVFRTPTKMGKGILVSPTVDGNLLLGPTAENIDDKGDTKTTPAGLASVARSANEQVKGIPGGKSITSFAGLRAVGSTGDFIINSPRAGFYNVAGIESPGLSASPAIATYVADMLRRDGVTLTPKAGATRVRESMHAFRHMTVEQKNEVIRRDPSYAKIVCRCEGVTEGEILAAIRTNPRPRDLDGVKRRTRAQMGRCQGGFCSPTVVELLAREMGVPFEAVTKSGGGSYINVGRTKGADAQ